MQIDDDREEPIVFQKFSCTRLEEERRVKRTFSYVVEQFDRYRRANIFMKNYIAVRNGEEER